MKNVGQLLTFISNLTTHSSKSFLNVLAMFLSTTSSVFSPTNREDVLIYCIYVIINCTIIRFDIPSVELSC
jgi:hypothetical protein